MNSTRSGSLPTQLYAALEVMLKSELHGEPLPPGPTFSDLRLLVSRGPFEFILHFQRFSEDF